MRRSVVGSVLVLAVGFVLIVACSAHGGADIGELGPGSDKAPTESASIPPSPSDGDDSEDPTSSIDASAKADGSKPDAGPPPPESFTPCSKIDEIREKTCGICGKASTICTSQADGGAPVWSQYSSCNGQLAGGCEPGTTLMEPCGNCGTRPKTCKPTCSFSFGQCGGQPAGACPAGAIELTAAGCPANTFRARTCSDTCAFSTFSDCAPPPAKIEAPKVVGTTNYTYVVLNASTTAKRLLDVCPDATLGAALVPTAYVQVHNPNATQVKVQIYNSQVLPGGPIFETLLATYSTDGKPTTEVARKKCTKGVSSFSDASLTGDDRFAALDSFENVTIPPGKTIWVYNASRAPASTGVVKLNVRLDAL